MGISSENQQLSEMNRRNSERLNGFENIDIHNLFQKLKNQEDSTLPELKLSNVHHHGDGQGREPDKILGEELHFKYIGSSVEETGGMTT